jgi:hypothetical protein
MLAFFIRYQQNMLDVFGWTLTQQRTLEEIKKIIAEESKGLNSGKVHLNKAE